MSQKRHGLPWVKTVIVLGLTFLSSLFCNSVFSTEFEFPVQVEKEVESEANTQTTIRITNASEERFRLPFEESRPERPPRPPKRLRISVSKKHQWHKNALAWNPRLYETAHQKWDDLSTGKSCVWNQNNRTYYRGRWMCQDCGNRTDTCIPLQRRGRCPRPPALMHWDDNDNVYHMNAQSPRQRTHFRTQAANNPTTHVHKFWDEPTEYETAPCSPHLELPCFDLERCTNIAQEDGPMKVYLHNAANASGYMDTTSNTKNVLFKEALERVQRNMPGVVEATDNHSEACLFLVVHGSFHSPEEMIHSPEYMAGQNHLIVNSNLLLGSRGDHPFPHHFNYELAALMAPTLEAGFLRPGYDQVLPLPSVWRRPKRYDGLDLHRRRKWLLSFKGRIHPKLLVPYQVYRWLAAEYWHNESDVFVDLHCGDGEPGYESEEGQGKYGEFLMNSTFVFAPGGLGQTSYRFTEGLNADAIPVVMSYMILPFEPEMDWSGCVVRVAEARIPDVPRMLRSMPEEEIRSRRERCRALFRGVIGREEEESGWTSQPYAKGALSTPLRIWRLRILQAFRRRSGLAAIDAALTDYNNKQ